MTDKVLEPSRNDLQSRKVQGGYVPSSVYRIQLNREFTFKQAAELVPYWKELGIGAVYCSPFLQAIPGSMHGYNITDPAQLNAEIGTREDYENFCRALKEHGIGQVVDIVPNHMGINGPNPWWQDVLENGPSSVYAEFFDIDWSPGKKELKGKVLIPVLGDFYGDALEKGEIRIVYGDGAFTVDYLGNRFPVDPRTYPVILEQEMETLKQLIAETDKDFLEYLSIITAFKNLAPSGERDEEKKQERRREKEVAKNRLRALTEANLIIGEFVKERVRNFNGKKEEPSSFDKLDALLNQQSYRLAYWRVAAEEINYRRFFDVHELAAVRMEDEKVFKAYHAFLFDLISEGKIQGLRIDHPDGLYDPPAYFERLQAEYAARSPQAQESFPLYVTAEKILDRSEKIPEDWDIAGTVGYEFLNILNGLFVDRRNEKEFEEIYENFIGHKIDFDELVYSRKKFFLLMRMAGEINSLGYRLDRISESGRRYRDFTRYDLTLAIREVIACFPVYRTYISPGGDTVSPRDEKYIRIAVERAKSKTPQLNPFVFEFLRNILLLKLDPGLTERERKLYRDFVLRFQQLTAPVMAKGLEDTAFYVYNRLVSLNEVGGDPFYFGCAREEFHRRNVEKLKRWPGGMNASSTHDTKRSEDVRMRIDVLSEIPKEWAGKIAKWSVLNKPYKKRVDDTLEPRPNTEYFIYQTLLGVWPAGLETGEDPEFQERLWQYFLKAVREAKTYTDWWQPNDAYEEAVKFFLFSILSKKEFLQDFLPFQKKISRCGVRNSLCALILKIASPGVPDFYQGSELFEYRLVDPDNRRPVDYGQRLRMLDALKQHPENPDPAWFTEALENPSNGKLKMFVTRRLLQCRRQHAELFLYGDYLPLKVEGPREKQVTAFLRCLNGKKILTVTSRFFAADENGSWEGTEIILPDGLERAVFKDVLTGNKTGAAGQEGRVFVAAAEIFRALPGAVLEEEKT